MSGRPWLEALKGMMKEDAPDIDMPAETFFEILPPQGCKRCESPSRYPFAPFAPPPLQGFREIALQDEESLMSGRPWLEALKATIREHSADTDGLPQNIPEAPPSEGCKRCESRVDVPTPVVDRQSAEKVRRSWGEEERRLMAAGWEPKERCGRIIWQRPDNGFYYSQEVALHFLDSEIVGTPETRAGQTKGGNTTG
jgi:hypothetical protein